MIQENKLFWQELIGCERSWEMALSSRKATALAQRPEKRHGCMDRHPPLLPHLPGHSTHQSQYL